MRRQKNRVREKRGKTPERKREADITEYQSPGELLGQFFISRKGYPLGVPASVGCPA